MAESYSSLFGTNGSGRQNRIGSLFGQQPSATQPTATGQQPAAQPAPRPVQQAQQTFAQMQQAGQARPAPPPVQPQTYTPYAGSQQAMQARTQMMGNLQQQLAQPTRFDTQAFQQIRQAQAANLQTEFTEQQRQLNEELARRGLSASTIGAAGMGRLAGAQSRALADIDAQLLQQAAQTQAQDRLAALQAGGQFAELAGSQDLAEFESRRAGQAQQFQEGLQAAQFGQGQSEFDRRMALEAAQAEQRGGQFEASLSSEDQRFSQNLQEQQASRLQQLGLSTRELDQRASQIQQQDRSLGLQEARDLAEIGFRADQLQQQESQFGRTLSSDEARQRAQMEFQRDEMAQRNREFEQTIGIELRRMGVTEQEFAERKRQFDEEFEQRKAQLAQQESQFGRTLGESALDRQLREQLGMGQLGQQQRQFQLQLAQALSGMSAEMQRNLMAIFARMGTPGGTVGSGAPTGGAPTGGVPTGTGVPPMDETPPGEAPPLGGRRPRDAEY